MGKMCESAFLGTGASGAKNHTQELPLRLQPGAVLVKKSGLCVYVWQRGLTDEVMRVYMGVQIHS